MVGFTSSQLACYLELFVTTALKVHSAFQVLVKSSFITDRYISIIILDQSCYLPLAIQSQTDLKTITCTTYILFLMNLFFIFQRHGQWKDHFNCHLLWLLMQQFIAFNPFYSNFIFNLVDLSEHWYGIINLWLKQHFFNLQYWSAHFDRYLLLLWISKDWIAYFNAHQKYELHRG